MNEKHLEYKYVLVVEEYTVNLSWDIHCVKSFNGTFEIVIFDSLYCILKPDNELLSVKNL